MAKDNGHIRNIERSHAEVQRLTNHAHALDDKSLPQSATLIHQILDDANSYRLCALGEMARCIRSGKDKNGFSFEPFPESFAAPITRFLSPHIRFRDQAFHVRDTNRRVTTEDMQRQVLWVKDLIHEPDYALLSDQQKTYFDGFKAYVDHFRPALLEDFSNPQEAKRVFAEALAFRHIRSLNLMGDGLYYSGENAKTDILTARRSLALSQDTDDISAEMLRFAQSWEAKQQFSHEDLLADVDQKLSFFREHVPSLAEDFQRLDRHYLQGEPLPVSDKQLPLPSDDHPRSHRWLYSGIFAAAAITSLLVMSGGWAAAAAVTLSLIGGYHAKKAWDEGNANTLAPTENTMASHHAAVNDANYVMSPPALEALPNYAANKPAHMRWSDYVVASRSQANYRGPGIT